MKRTADRASNRLSTMILIIEGNIGAGKTTLLGPICELIASHRGLDSVVAIVEPVTYWSSEDNLLKRAYENRAAFGLQLQILVTLNMLENERKAVRMSREGKIVVMNRSLFSTNRVFRRLFRLCDEVSAADRSIYETVSNRFTPEIGGDAENGYDRYCRLYLRTPVEECMKRIRKRAREGEDRICIDYLRLIEEFTDKAIIDDTLESRRSVVVDGRFAEDEPLSAAVAPCSHRQKDEATQSLQEFILSFINS